MSVEMDEEIKRWTARRKSALVLDIIQGKTTVSESSRQFDLPPSEIESWIDQAKAGMERQSPHRGGGLRSRIFSLEEVLHEAIEVYGQPDSGGA